MQINKTATVDIGLSEVADYIKQAAPLDLVWIAVGALRAVGAEGLAEIREVFGCGENGLILDALEAARVVCEETAQPPTDLTGGHVHRKNAIRPPREF